MKNTLPELVPLLERLPAHIGPTQRTRLEPVGAEACKLDLMLQYATDGSKTGQLNCTVAWVTAEKTVGLCFIAVIDAFLPKSSGPYLEEAFASPSYPDGAAFLRVLPTETHVDIVVAAVLEVPARVITALREQRPDFAMLADLQESYERIVRRLHMASIIANGLIADCRSIN